MDDFSKSYEVCPNGILHQVRAKPITYTPDYAQKYNRYKTTRRMSLLRWHLIKDVVGHVESVLDFGYGNGDFLKVGVRRGTACYGYDVSGYPLPKGAASASFSHHVQLITFFDSLEHVESIHSVLRCVYADYLMITVPWCHYHSMGRDWFMAWKHRRFNEHLWHFDIESLCRFMQEFEFRLIHCSNAEDAIRKSDSALPNTLTAVFKHSPPA